MVKLVNCFSSLSVVPADEKLAWPPNSAAPIHCAQGPNQVFTIRKVPKCQVVVCLK